MTDLHENTVRYPVGGCGVTSVLGLSETEAERRLQNRGPIGHPPTSRSYVSIVRANVFSVSNLVLAVFGVVALTFGPPQDALFLGILLSNALIGIVQEVRAKAALDRLAVLVAPTATVIRDGRARQVHVEQLVVGDLVRAQAGDGIVADGKLMTSDREDTVPEHAHDD